MFAIVRAGGRQEKVVEGTVVVVDRLDAEAGDAYTFDQVLLIEGADGAVMTGAPYLTGATVTGVLPNGHLLIAGEKQIGLNENVDVLRFSGQVDPRAIQPGNQVPSAQIANVRLEHRGRGQQAEAQGIGWLGRFFLNVLPI